MRSLSEIDNPFGAESWFVEETESTMDDAERVCARGGGPGSFVMAGFQSRGRGRTGSRKWEAKPGDALTFTIALSPRPGFPRSLRTGLAVARCLESLRLEARIKWPNDILVSGKKICGILIIANSKFEYCGIGLNVAQRGFENETLRRPATSLFLEGLVTSPMEVLPRILGSLKTVEDYSGDRVRDEVQSRLWAMNEALSLESVDGVTKWEGIARGIGADGSLLLEREGRLERHYQGE